MVSKSTCVKMVAILGAIAPICAAWLLLSSPPTQADAPSRLASEFSRHSREYPRQSLEYPRYSREFPRHSRESGNPLMENAVTTDHKSGKEINNNRILPAAPSPPDPCFANRGDMDHTGGTIPVDIADIVWLVDYLYANGPPAVCPEEGDVDASGQVDPVDLLDLVYLVDFLFRDGTEPPPLKDYLIIGFNGQIPFEAYAFHTYSRRIDTFAIPVRADYPLAQSADGEKLYISYWVADIWDYNVKVVSTATGEIIADLPYNGLYGFAFSPDNKLVALQGDSLLILNTDDYSVHFTEPDQVGRGIFSADSKTFYCGRDNSVWKIDMYDSMTISRRDFPEGGIGSLVPTPDEKKWLLRLNKSWQVCMFAVYDVELDSIIFSETNCPGYGDVEMTPDGRFAFYTYAPNMQFGCPVERLSFTVFDIEANEIHKVIEVPITYLDDGPVPYFIIPEQMSITPDGRFLVCFQWDGHKSFLLFDIKEMAIKETYIYDNWFTFNSPSCQTAQ